MPSPELTDSIELTSTQNVKSINVGFANYGKLNPASEVNDSVIVELDFYGGVNGETSLL